MTKTEEMTNFLTKMLELRAENDLVVDKVCEIFGDNAFDSPLIENGYKYVDVAVDLAEKYFVDTGEWLSWFIYDNEFGNNKLELGVEGVVYKICNIEDFVAWFILNVGEDN